MLNVLVDPVRRQQRVQDIKATRNAISRDRIVADLRALPVDRGAALLVHSSLKSLGFVEGGPETVVNALVDVFVTRNAGTVMLPTFSVEGTMHNTLSTARPFDVAATPSNLGAIPEVFRRVPGARRSIHPTHSFAAVGRDAGWLTEAHHQCGTNFGAGSPMMRLMERNGYIVGLGTNLGNVTFYHCLEDAEDRFPFNVYSPDSPMTVRCKGYSGDENVLRLSAHDPRVSATRIDRPENAAIREFFTAWFERHAGLRWFQVGEARVWIVRAEAMYRETRLLMMRGLTIYSTQADITRLEAQQVTASV